MFKSVPKGAIINVPGIDVVNFPFDMNIEVMTEAVGFLTGRIFKGVARFSYDVRIVNMEAPIRAVFEARLGSIPERSQFEGGGEFWMKFQAATEL